MRTDLSKLADPDRGNIGALEFAIPVWATATALVLVLIVAWLFGSVAKWLLRRRARLNTTTCMVLSIVGTAVGLFIAGAVDHRMDIWSAMTIVLGLVSSIVAVGAYALIAARLQTPTDISVAELLESGESERVEFKSTARMNLRTKQRDPALEAVIAKTVAAFLNSDGGNLLIGVDDDGTPLGLDADFTLLRQPDADRFELWLRDLLTTMLGQSTAAEVGISFEKVPRPSGGADSEGPAEVLVCRVECTPSPRPVYLRGTKNNAVPEFWVRAGNSSRQLSVDQAAEYVMYRWPLGVGRAVAAQVQAAVRFSASS
ncbi:putative DNA binding domain-containing protein [Gordonia rubripertincta]|uniref:DNA binding domain-containing protein n=1 Tax=Gordonia rubripertincta TaxID=36822 RepID=A0AAW4G2I0_GORRU|nr:ATP-binding protein [Gordonia rubripertincta]MBM7277712.1 putative DNA binding domain-containing protein [Gordonia rubripertincta]